ncbi:hypothetical protein NW762_004584 [Fusarium torreyae]|uniref:Quinate repressor protein n=1 Tax=Fusarium torreyae TaxID=1237075 RepID=A0A9W8S4H4_9HYPO|nr:hypothetical protein NW762_004584 [Fusarium torreyae]
MAGTEDAGMATDASRCRPLSSSICPSCNLTQSPATPGSPGAVLHNGTIPSCEQSPLPLTRLEQTSDMLQYTSEASLLLVGVRGVGKTTLAMIAASSMNRKVIDLELAFQTAMGVFSNEFKATHGIAKYRDQQATFLKAVLDRYHDNCILVCSWVDTHIQPVYYEFATHHPVVHVTRDAEALARLFNFADKSKIQKMLHVSRIIWRSCTNFEFFNFCEEQTSPSNLHSRLPSIGIGSSPSLMLKHTERHLLRFLSRIYPACAFPIVKPGYPLGEVSIEDRGFSYAVSLVLSDVLDDNFELDQHIVGSDAVQLNLQYLGGHETKARTSTASTSGTNFELVDYLARGVAKVRRCTSMPIILHVVVIELNDSLVHGYLGLLHHCLRLAPEMMTVDLRLDDDQISGITASRQRTKIIGSYSVTGEPAPWDSSIWVDMYTKANRLGCHFARFVRPALSTNDNLGVLRIKHQIAEKKDAKVPLIAYNSGTIGRTSAVFNRIMTEVQSPALKSSGHIQKNYWSQRLLITAPEATSALFSSFHLSALNLYVFGQDVDYSLSPAMITSGFKACGIPHRYQPWSTSTIQDVRHLIHDPLFGGATVTYPFKVEALGLTSSISRHAQAIGALNTLIPIRQLEQDGSVPTGAKLFEQMNQSGPVKAIYGENTDWIGIGACIRRGLSPANAIAPHTCGLVLGAGGMARAAIYAMLQLGVTNIVVYNRTPTRAEKVASHFIQLAQEGHFQRSARSCKVRFHVLSSLDQLWPGGFDLPTIIISCIPTDISEDSSLPRYEVRQDYFHNPTGGVAIDVGYKQLNSPLVVQARRQAERRWVVLDGLDVLPEQGFAQFELFTARPAPRQTIRREVHRVSGR